MEKFSFGKNWQRYIKIYFNEEIINEAKKSLLSYQPEDYYKDTSNIVAKIILGDYP